MKFFSVIFAVFCIYHALTETVVNSSDPVVCNCPICEPDKCPPLVCSDIECVSPVEGTPVAAVETDDICSCPCCPTCLPIRPCPPVPA